MLKLRNLIVQMEEKRNESRATMLERFDELKKEFEKELEAKNLFISQEFAVAQKQ